MAGVRRKQVWLLLGFIAALGAALYAHTRLDRRRQESPVPVFISDADARTPAPDWPAVRSLLHERCVRCHGPAKQKGNLRLDSLALLLAGGKSGPSVEPGRPERSPLIAAIRQQTPHLRMPPAEKLPDRDIEALTAWVADRSFWANLDQAHPFRLAQAPMNLERRARHWAFQPLTAAPPPAVRHQAWPLTGIDRFILARMEAEGLAPPRQADRLTLLRRLSFDLIGLPPSPEELRQAQNDPAPNWYEKAVDRLLASPHFGERWARHWLDLVRFAESRGHEEDHDIPNAFEYRDYVIRALNADVSMRQLIVEHVAGDLLDPPRTHPIHGWNESVIGTGFWHLGEWLHSPVDTRRDEAERIENQIDVFGKAFLGLTLACARCHDHKYDPVRQEDYYALAGFVKSASYRQVRFATMEQEKLSAAEMTRVREQSGPPLARGLAGVLGPGVDRFAAYLLAARRAIQAGGTPASVDAVARASRLSTLILRRLVEDLGRASDDPDDVLYLWARVAGMREPLDLTRVLQDAESEWRTRDEAAARGLDGSMPVIDDPEEWIRDGFAHGLPGHAGDVDIGVDPAWPIAGMLAGPTARRDPLWPELVLASPTQREPGKLGEQPRAGQTIRSRTFVLQRNGLAYLVEGSGRAFVDVDSYRLFVGPLHQQLLLDWKDAGKARWVWHDLAPYRGHQIHVELSAGLGSGAAVRRVIQCERNPGVVNSANRLLRRHVQQGDIASPEALAGHYQQCMAEALSRLAAGRIPGSAHAEDHARLADWLVRRPCWAEHAAPEARRRFADLGRHAQAQLSAARARVPAASRTAVALLDGSPADMPLMIRGEPERAGPAVPRRFLEVYDGPEPFVARTHATRGSGRLYLAHRLTDSAAPLIARVMVNRLWQHLFGQGIVPSVDNFGLLGEPPADQELLDSLANDFIARGWSTKTMIRAIVLSRAYRLSSDPHLETDPKRAWFRRRVVRRLDAEAIRDAILAASGSLDRKLYGPGVPVPKEVSSVNAGLDRKRGGPRDGGRRRSIYVAVRRLELPTFLQTFDFPAPTTTVGQRDVSIVPAQCLTLMNDPFLPGQARRWAECLLANGPATPPARVEELYLRAFARNSSDAEMAEVLRFLQEQATRHGCGTDDPRPWADLIHALINVKEFVHVR